MSHNQWFLPPVHVEAFSPRRSSSVTNQWRDPYGRFITNGGSGYAWGAAVDAGLTKLGGTSFGWKGRNTTPLIPDTHLERGINTYWPSPGKLTPPWHDYRFADPNNGYYHFQIPTGIAKGVTNNTSILWEYFNVGARGTGSNGDQDDNINPKGVLSYQASHVAFWLYYDAPEDDSVIPPNTFAIRFRWGSGVGATAPNASLDRARLIDSPIVGGWNYIGFSTGIIEDPTPSGGWNTASAYTDIANVVRGGIIFDRVAWELRQNISSDLFGDDGKIHLYVTGGRQIDASHYNQTSPVQELVFPFPLVECVEGATVYDQEIPESDFNTAVLMDTEKGETWLGGECVFPCAMESPTENCTTAGQLPGALYVGGSDGYIWQLEEKNLSWGNPLNLFVWSVDPDEPFDIDNQHLTVNVDPLGLPASTYPLATDDDGNGMLDGLVVMKWSPSTKAIELRRIVTNDHYQITVDADWSVDPAIGDQIMVAPLPMMVHWEEVRTLFYSVFNRLSMNPHEQSLSDDPTDLPAYDPIFVLEIFTSGTRKSQADYSAATVRRIFRLSDIRKTEQGWIELRRKESQARGMRLTVYQGQNGRLVLSSIQAEELLSEREVGK